MNGYLYIQSNPSFRLPLLKIGLSRDPEARRRSLSSSGLPEDFQLVAAFPVKDMSKAETLVFQTLAAYRYNKEFFLCSNQKAIMVCQNVQSFINRDFSGARERTHLSDDDLDRLKSIWHCPLEDIEPSDIDMD